MNGITENRTPLYKTIELYIRGQIRLGQLKAEDKLPSEQELMEQFGVSRITVNKALTQLAQEGFICRIPGRGSFILSQPQNDGADLTKAAEFALPAGTMEARAQHGAPRPQRLVGYIVQSLADGFALRLFNGLLQAFRQKGYSLIIKCSFDQDGERRAIRELYDLGVEGLVIFPVDQETYSDEILSLKLNHFPLVLVDRVLPGIQTHQVINNNVLGAQMAVEYLCQLGHEHIALCSSAQMPTSSASDRIKGYTLGMEQQGKMIDPSLIVSNITFISRKEKSDQRLVAMLQSEKATACIATESGLAALVYRMCQDMHIRVPEDFSILSFDNPDIEDEEHGFFTHIAQAEADMGAKAAQLLMDVLERRLPQKRSQYEHLVLDPSLVVRLSTAKPGRKKTENIGAPFGRTRTKKEGQA